MKLWIDDVRPAPDGYYWLKSVNNAIRFITYINGNEDVMGEKIDLIDIDHDAGDFAYNGGDYIKLLDWLEETGRNYPIHIHSMNPSACRICALSLSGMVGRKSDKLRAV